MCNASTLVVQNSRFPTIELGRSTNVQNSKRNDRKMVRTEHVPFFDTNVYHTILAVILSYSRRGDVDDLCSWNLNDEVSILSLLAIQTGKIFWRQITFRIYLFLLNVWLEFSYQLIVLWHKCISFVKIIVFLIHLFWRPLPLRLCSSFGTFHFIMRRIYMQNWALKTPNRTRKVILKIMWNFYQGWTL